MHVSPLKDAVHLIITNPPPDPFSGGFFYNIPETFFGYIRAVTRSDTALCYELLHGGVSSIVISKASFR
jgi:hypothetical protein